MDILVIGGTTPLDKYAYNFYKRAKVNMATVPIKSVFSSVRVYNDLLFLKIYPNFHVLFDHTF